MSFDNLDLRVLKTLVSNKKHAIDFSNDCDTNLFSPELWNFAHLAVNYTKTYKEVPTLPILVDRLSKGNNDKQIEYVRKVWAEVDSTKQEDKEFKYLLEKLKSRFAEKQIFQVKDSLGKLEPGSINLSKTVTDMQKALHTIKGLSQKKSYERKTLKDAVPTFREEYNAKMNDPTFDSGLKTGYSYLDSVTDGLRPGELLLVGGESGGGKSMLLMNMAIQLWLQGNTIDMEDSFGPGNSVLYFSLEMPFKPCLNRVLARLSGCPSKKIRNAKLSNDEAVKLKKALRFITKYQPQFEIVDIPRGATMENLEAIFEDAKLVYDPKVIVIDYLGLMDYEGPEADDWLKLGKISEKIHEFARVHNCIVLSAVQLNRAKGGKDAEDKIGMHRIGRSALIMTNANIAIQIETRPNEKSYVDMNYHLIKNRDGELGKGVLIKNLACGTLIDNPAIEDATTFELRDPDDISDKIDMLDI